MIEEQIFNEMTRKVPGHLFGYAERKEMAFMLEWIYTDKEKTHDL